MLRKKIELTYLSNISIYHDYWEREIGTLLLGDVIDDIKGKYDKIQMY